MTRFVESLGQFLDIPSLDPVARRRSRLLNIIVLGVSAIMIIAMIATVFTVVAGTEESRRQTLTLLVACSAILIGSALILAINRRGLGSLASSLFLLLLTIALVFSDRPEEVVGGRTLFMFAVPILMASALLRPYASFIVAGLVGVLINFIAISADLVPDPFAVLGFLGIALVSWLSARSLERASEELRAANRELNLLHRSGQLFSSSLDLDQVLKTIINEAHGLLGANDTSIWLRDPESSTLVRHRNAHAPAESLEATPEKSVAERVARTGKSTIVADIRSAEHDDAGLVESSAAALRSFLAVPLWIRKDVPGAIVVAHTDVGHFTKPDLRLLESLAVDAAIAIENARLYDFAQREIAVRKRAQAEVNRRNLELNLLNHVIATATSTLDTEQVLHMACQELGRAFDLPQVEAALLNAEGTNANVVAEYLAPGRASRLGGPFPMVDYAPSGYQLEHRILPLSMAVGQDKNPQAIHQLMAERHAATLLLVPIPVARGRVAGSIGLVALEHRDFNPEEVALAQSVAAAAGQALETARLYQALRRHAEQLEETVAHRTLELQEALELARAADRVKSEFVSNVSHELRTPLTNIKLYLSLMNRGAMEKRQSYQETVRREVGRLQDLIEGLLDLSRLELGKTRANMRPTDLNLLLKTLAADRGPLVADRRLQLEVQTNGNLPLAMADPKLTEQVLTNLLTNAINYTRAGGKIRLTTALVPDEDQRWITVTVTDTGPGISPEEQERLFERFYRGEAGRASDAPGTGLGLAICKEIMDLHDGRITVESEIDNGSAFTIWLSAAPDGAI